MKEVADGAFAQETAKKYGIPRRTLRNHIATGVSIKQVRMPILSKGKEDELRQRIVRLSEIGIPLTLKIVKKKISKKKNKKAEECI